MRPESLKEWQEMFNGIYDEHDRKYYMFTETLLLRIVEEMGVIAEALRKEDIKAVVNNIPHLFCWLMAFWTRYNIDIEEALWAKYPAICPYCFRREKCLCITEELKYNPDNTNLNRFWRDRKRMPKTLRDWQLMIEKIYGNINKIKPTDTVWKHLMEEICEMIKEYRYCAVSSRTTERLAEESADTLAWLLSFCTKLDVDLDEITWQTFPGECNVCHKEKCDCGYY